MRPSGNTAKPRLWIISELYYPEQTSSGYFVTRIAEGLSEDYRVSAACGQPSYSERGIRAPRRECHGGVDIYRVRATHFDKDYLLLRALNIATLTLSFAWFCLWNFRRGDRVLAVTNPFTLPFAVGLATKIRRCRSFLLVHDVYPEVLSAVGMLRPTGVLYRILSILFRFAFRLFDEIIVLGDDMAEVIAAKTARAVSRMHLIPNWGDVDEISRVSPDINEFRMEHGLRDKFVVQFSGNIGRTHDVETVLTAADQLRARADIVFLFVGYGGKSKLISSVESGGPSNVRFLPRQPRERLSEMLSASDATIISFVDGMYGLSVPSRMYNVMAAGTPIIAIADQRSELSRTIDRTNAGWVLTRNDASELVALIEALATDEGRSDAALRGAAGRAAAENRYSLPIVLQQYRALLA